MINLPRLIPVDFSLQNPVNNEGVLFTINQGRSGQKLDLKVWNKSPGDLKFPSGTGKVSATNYHISLSFPPGLLLKPKSLKINAAEAFEADWSYRHAKDDNGFDCYYFLWSGEEFILKKEELEESLQFELKKIHVDTQLAWRHTTVVLKTRGMLLGDVLLPESTRRIPMTVLHTFAMDLSDLESVRNFSGLKTEVTELRDTLIPPIQVRVIRGWNMLASGNERSIDVELFLNPAFFNIHTLGELNAPKNQAQVRIFPIKDTSSVDLTAETINNGNWEVLTNTSKEEMVIFGPNKRGQKITRTTPFQLKLTLNTGDLEMVDLEVQCGGFEHGSNALEDFTLHLPLNIGPLETAEAEGEMTRVVAWGASADENSNGILQIRNNAESDSPNLRIGVLTAPANASDRERSWIQSHGSKPLYINYVDNDLILNGQGGNVGIGNTHPEKKLDVIGESRFRGKLSIEGNTEISGSLIAGSAKTGDWPGGSHYACWGSKNMIEASKNNYAIAQHNTSGKTWINSPELLLFGIGDTEKMRIEKDGQVKIGTAQTGTWPRGSNYSFWGNANLDHKNTSGNYALLQDKRNGDTFLNSTRQIMFRINNSDKMRLHASGNLTIGRTSDPGYKLYVSGNCFISTFRTNSITIGGTTIKESDLKLLVDLARGKKAFSIVNRKTSQHLYHNLWAKYDDNRMHALTWKSNNAFDQGLWYLKPW